MDAELEFTESTDNHAPGDINPEQSDMLKAIKAENQALQAELERLANERRFVGLQPGESGETDANAFGSSYEAQLKNARGGGSILEAIRIKQEAAREGVILI